LILICNDEPDSHSLTAVHLASAGYELVFAADCAQVRATLNEARRPELAILNWQTGSPENQAVCALLRSEAGSAALPILALGPGTADERMAAVTEGVDDLLSRPVDTAQLLARVRSLLLANRRRAEAEVELHRLTEIGIALSAEHDLQRLLSKIVGEARAINHADAATLYTVDRETNVLRFQIAQNESLSSTLAMEVDLPPVPLDAHNVSAYVALTGETVNIADVYASQGFDFSGPRQYDALTGYRSQSMLVVPIRNHEDEVIAVLQLINAQDAGTRRVVSFQPRLAERSEALASQAGVALTNAQLITDLKALLEGLIQALADAVDQKSSHTAGHIRRVTRLALSLAEAVNDTQDERFQHVRFGEASMEELRVAGLLHDIGKIVVPEHLVDKATKLECIHDRISEIRMRFSVIRRGLENEALRSKLALVQAGASAEALGAVDRELAERLVALEDDFCFVESANTGGESMLAERLARLRAIAALTYRDDDGAEQPYLTPDELRNLSIMRGTLLPEELDVIRSHVTVSQRLLSRIPFPRKLRDVPIIAADHHEALDGTGYPSRKTAADLPLQSRILAVADIFDALTASDRPYKKAFPLEVAYRILRDNAERGKLDGRLVELFIEAQCHLGVGDDSAAQAAPASA